MKILSIGLVILFLGSVFLIGNVSKNNDIRSRAFDPSANAISNVQVTKESNMIVVTWTTATPSSSHIEYGLEKNQLSQTVNATGDNTLLHSVKFTPQVHSRHYLRIRATENNGKETISPIYNYKP